MANQPDTNNRIMSMRLPRELYWKTRRAAESCGLDVSSYIRMVLTEETINTQLSYEDIIAIAEEIKDAESKKG